MTNEGSAAFGGKDRMAGLFNRLYNALCIEETVHGPAPRKAPDRCGSCVFWVPGDQLDSSMVPSARAIAWAQDNGYGRCQHRDGPAKAGNKGDKKRFTLPDAYCTNHVPKGPKPTTGGGGAGAGGGRALRSR